MLKYLISLGFILIFLTFITPAFAIPTLQLYIPGATYGDNPWFPSEESWITYDNPFELQVLGATTPSKVTIIDNLELHIALLEEEYPSVNTWVMTITDIDPNIDFSVDIYTSTFTYGRPDYSPFQGMPYHSIFPTYYKSVALLSLLVGTAGETVYNYNPGETGQDSGDIRYYSISYNPIFTFIHFDATGYAHNGQPKYVFAPFSHDADAAIPEPGTLLLLGSGLLGLAGYGRLRLRRRKG